MAGRQMYTFRDWPMTNIPTKDIEGIKMSNSIRFKGVFSIGDKVKLNRPIQIIDYSFLEKSNEYKLLPAGAQGEVVQVFYTIEQSMISSITINEYRVQFTDGTNCEHIPEYLLELVI